MELGLIGTGKMGYNLALNLKEKGHRVVAYDINPGSTEGLADRGITVVREISEVAGSLSGRKVIFLMVPVGQPVDDAIAGITPQLIAGDVIIDGGNSNYKDSIRRYENLMRQGIHFLDCGTSGGVSGALRGVCLMVGGDAEAVRYCEPVFKDISVPDGYLYTGKAGSGHFCKMIHNGIEYGMMQAIAEGFELLHKSGFDFDLQQVAGVWNHGSVVRSWLMELLENALAKDACLSTIKGIMKSTGEGKWTVETALDNSVCAPVIALSLLMRYRSLEDDTFSGKVVAALRNQFGGHQVVTQA